jgi:hypothetical protein
VASLALGVVGAYAGSFFGPVGTAVGWAIGSMLGNIFFPQKTPATLHDLHMQGSSYGVFLKRFWGKIRFAGTCIWQTDQQQHNGGGKGGKGQPSQQSFTASFDIALCETQVAKLTRFWAAGRLNYDFSQPNGPKIPFTLYDGNATQLTDPTEEAVEGAGNVPAYRGISRVVFHDWDMTQFGNTLPQLSFEVVSHQGDIPFRVSTFDPAIDAEGDPYNIHATYDPDTKLITVGSYENPLAATYSSRQFKIDGTPVGTPTGPDVLDPGPHSAARFDGINGTVSNSQVAFCFSDDGSGHNEGGWYLGTQLLLPIGTESSFNRGVYQNGFIYGSSSNAAGAKILRWDAPDGIPAGTVSASFVMTGVFWADVVTSGGGGYIWTTSGAVGTDDALWQLNEDLTLVHVWTHAELPSTWPSDFGDFVFYHGMIAGNFSFGGTRKFAAYKINPDFTFTLVGDINQDGGGSIIQLFNGLVLGRDGVVSLDPPDGSVFLSEVVGDICDDSGQSSYNVSQLSAIPVDGVVQESQTTGRALIEMLMPVFFFDAVESDGVVKFVVRGGLPIVTFLDDDLAAHMDHDGLPSKVTCVHTPDVDLPSSLVIAYINKDADYQVNTQTWQRMTGGSRDVKTITVPVVLTDAHAKKIVDAWGWNAWTERDAYSWQTSRKYAAYEPTDVCFVDGVVNALRITKKIEGATGVIKWEGVPSVGANFHQAGAGGAAKDPGQTLPVSQKSQLVLLDLPLLHDADAPNGIYAAMAGAKNSSYPGGQLFKSLDGTTYSSIATATRANTMGVATTQLGDYQGPNVFDDGSIVRVTIGKGGGTLLSVTQTDVLNGDNEGVLGSEIFQWKNATLVSASVYDLSGLLRGRRGTEWATATHTIGEPFVAFDPVPLNPPARIAEIGSTEYYKAVTAGQTLASATAKTFANMGNALKPYSPTYLGGGCDASGNVTGNFLARTRIGGDGILAGPKPLSEATESYIVQITDASYTLVARIIPVTAQTFSYSGAQAITDFGALQHDIFWTVGQIGAVSIGALSRGRCPSTGSSNTLPLVPLVPYSFNPIITPPQPPGGGRPVNHVFPWPSSDAVFVNPFLVGTTWVGQFTTGGTVPLTGTIAISEYQSQAAQRHCFIANDSGGLSKVPRSEGYGTTATSFIGAAPGGAILLAGTTYYWITDYLQSDGSFGGPTGYNGSAELVFGNIT